MVEQVSGQRQAKAGVSGAQSPCKQRPVVAVGGGGPGPDDGMVEQVRGQRQAKTECQVGLQAGAPISAGHPERPRPHTHS